MKKWKGLLYASFITYEIIMFVFIAIGLLELIISIFAVPARAFLILQGLFFMFWGFMYTNFFTTRYMLLWLWLPISGNDILKVKIIFTAVFMVIIFIVTSAIFLIADFYAPIKGLNQFLLFYAAVLPAFFTVHLFVQAIILMNKRIAIIISNVLSFTIMFLLSMGPRYRLNETIYDFIKTVFIFKYPVLFLVFTYASCIFISFLFYKIGCKNFANAQYSPIQKKRF